MLRTADIDGLASDLKAKHLSVRALHLMLSVSSQGLLAVTAKHASRPNEKTTAGGAGISDCKMTSGAAQSGVPASGRGSRSFACGSCRTSTCAGRAGRKTHRTAPSSSHEPAGAQPQKRSRATGQGWGRLRQGSRHGTPRPRLVCFRGPAPFGCTCRWSFPIAKVPKVAVQVVAHPEGADRLQGEPQG